MTEVINRVAIKHAGTVWSLPRPARHHDVIAKIAKLAPHTLPVGPDGQGFQTVDGRFLDRFQAAKVAYEAGQIEDCQWPPYLYSEDLW